MTSWTLRLSLLISCVGSLLFQVQRRVLHSDDPDRYYHLVVSQYWKWREGFFVRSFPNVEGLGWGDFFPDKEPFFHVLTGIAFFFKESVGVFLVPVFTALALWMVLVVLVSDSRRSWWWSGVLVSLGILGQSYFLNRLSMLRPHTLAIVLFFLLFFFLERAKMRGVLLISALFALSYHAIYLPLLLAMTDMIVRWRAKRVWEPELLRSVFVCALGLAIGTALSPSFPGNILMSLRHLQIALFEVSSAGLNFGAELYPWTTSEFLRVHLGTFLALGLLMWELSRLQWRNQVLLFPFGAAVLFFALSFQSPRAQEYLIPTLLVGMGRLFYHWRKEKVSFYCPVLLGLAFIYPVVPFRDLALIHPAADRPSGIPESEWFSALQQLPESAPRVFNLEWDTSPMVLFAKPAARVIDLLDPSFLSEHDRPLHDARLAIAQGAIVDVYGYVHAAFHADYFLTKNSTVIQRLDSNPLFMRVFPKRSSHYSGSEALFRLNPKSRENFVTRFRDFRGAENLQVSLFNQMTPESAELKPIPSLNLSGSIYVDLFKVFEKSKSAAQTDRMRCVSLEVSDEERLKWVGRTILGVGGGRNVRIWMNGNPLYHSITMSSTPVPVFQLVKLSRPLRQTDRLQGLVCSLEEATTFGWSLSSWGEQELSQLCEKKGWKPPDTLLDARAWKKVGRSRISCLGDFALPSLPGEVL